MPIDDLPQQELGKGVDWLESVRVVDLTTSIAGPFASMLLADLGADVIKVERSGAGDDSRAWAPPSLDGESLWFLSVNRNKRSLELDLSSELGKGILRKLVATADAVILNALPKTQQKLGIDYESLAAINPKLVYVCISGFGIEGERANWACYDLIAEGYSGIMDLTGEADGEPQKIGTPAADLIAAFDAVTATLGAIYDAARTGRGHKIDVSLVTSMTRFLAPRIMAYLGSGDVPRRSGGRDSVIAIYQAFETADQPLTLGLGNDNIWKRFWKLLGRPEKSESPKTSSNAKRREIRAEIVDEIQQILLREPREHWLTLFREGGIPAGPINRLDEVVKDDHMLQWGMFYAVPRGDTLIPQVGSAVRVDGTAHTIRNLPPRLGEHTQEILAELGFAPQEAGKSQIQ